MGQDTGIGLVETSMVRRGLVPETPRSARWRPNHWPLQTEPRRMRARDKQQGCCSRKEQMRTPKKRGKKGRSDHTCTLEAFASGGRGGREAGKPGARVPAAMRAGCWEMHHEHAPTFHWGSEGDAPAHGVHLFPQESGNRRTVGRARAVPDASAWQAVREARLLPLHPAANAEAGATQNSIRVWSSLLQAAESQSINLFSLHPAQQIPPGIRSPSHLGSSEVGTGERDRWGD